MNRKVKSIRVEFDDDGPPLVATGDDANTLFWKSNLANIHEGVEPRLRFPRPWPEKQPTEEIAR